MTSKSRGSVDLTVTLSEGPHLVGTVAVDLTVIPVVPGHRFHVGATPDVDPRP